MPEIAYIPTDLAESLASIGHQVIVLTGYPNYPSGRVFKGYRQRLRQVELDYGFVVRRTPLFASHSRRAVARIVNYLSFSLSTLLASALFRRADVVYVYATQMTAAFTPFLMLKLLGVPYVLHVQDLWPDAILTSGMVSRRMTSRALVRLVDNAVSVVYGRAAAIVAIGTEMRSLLLERGVSKDMVHVIYNWARSEREDPVIDRPVKAPTVVAYAGSFGTAQGLETAVLAAAQLDEDGLILRLIGSGSEYGRLREAAERTGASNIEFFPPQSVEEVEKVYREADFQLVSLSSAAGSASPIPSKFQKSLASGAPVVISADGELAQLTRTHDLGFVGSAGSVTDLVEAFRGALRSSASERSGMATRAAAFYQESMSRSSSVGQLEKLLCMAANSRTAPTPESGRFTDERTERDDVK